MAPAFDSLFRRLVLAICSVLLGLALAAPTLAIPVQVDAEDIPGQCDPLAVPIDVHELGNPGAGFPPNEAIGSMNFPEGQPVCLPTYLGGPDEVVSMTNLTNTDFTEVWYVADPETFLTNWDGLVNGEEAFRIDSQISDPSGVNHPLMYESMVYDGIFRAGETWEFIIQDYSNALGVPASAFMSVGMVGGLSGGDSISSGSIVAIPEPGTIALFGVALTGLALMGRKRPKA